MRASFGRMSGGGTFDDWFKKIPLSEVVSSTTILFSFIIEKEPDGKTKKPEPVTSKKLTKESLQKYLAAFQVTVNSAAELNVMSFECSAPAQEYIALLVVVEKEKFKKDLKNLVGFKTNDSITLKVMLFFFIFC